MYTSYMSGQPLQKIILETTDEGKEVARKIKEGETESQIYQ